MAKKSNKRQLKADSNENNKIATKNQLNNDEPKKKKLKINSEKSEIKDDAVKTVVNASTNVAGENKLKNKKKNKAKKQLKVATSADNKATALESNTEETTKSKRQEFFKKKRAEFKEKQKLLAPREGPSATLEKLSLTEMKEKIAEIESRGNVSKTAARKLRILKKKVQMKESGEDTETSNLKGDASQTISKENKKSKLQGKVNANKNLNKQGKKKGKQVAEVSEKNIFVEDRIGTTGLKDSGNISEEEKDDLNAEKQEKKISDNTNIKNKQNENDSDEDADEDIDDCEEESMEDNTELDATINESDSKDSDEDDNEGKSSSEKVEKDETVSDVKKTNVQTKSKQDANKLKSKQNENNPNKKQRYVLFVGNVAYDATTVDIKKHFLTKVEKIKDIRIPSKPGTNTPRGFAYVEVENSEDYEKALSLHNTFINGRQIKVEYTTSGSKTASRNPEVIHKNRKLHALRKEGKLSGSKKFSQKRSFRRNFKNNPKNGPGKSES